MSGMVTKDRCVTRGEMDRLGRLAMFGSKFEVKLADVVWVETSFVSCKVGGGEGSGIFKGSTLLEHLTCFGFGKAQRRSLWSLSR